MADRFVQVEIVTPRRVAFKGDVTSISVPGASGGFQVLHNHAPLLAALTIGMVKLHEADGTERRFAVSGGFVEVRENKVVMLADAAERTDEIDRDRAVAARDRAEKRLAEKKPDLDFERAKLSFSRAVNRLRVLPVE